MGSIRAHVQVVDGGPDPLHLLPHPLHLHVQVDQAGLVLAALLPLGGGQRLNLP